VQPWNFAMSWARLLATPAMSIWMLI
jgi:hypothetical protein